MLLKPRQLWFLKSRVVCKILLILSNTLASVVIGDMQFNAVFDIEIWVLHESLSYFWKSEAKMVKKDETWGRGKRIKTVLMRSYM